MAYAFLATELEAAKKRIIRLQEEKREATTMNARWQKYNQKREIDAASKAKKADETIQELSRKVKFMEEKLADQQKRTEELERRAAESKLEVHAERIRRELTLHQSEKLHEVSYKLEAALKQGQRGREDDKSNDSIRMRVSDLQGKVDRLQIKQDMNHKTEVTQQAGVYTKQVVKQPSTKAGKAEIYLEKHMIGQRHAISLIAQSIGAKESGWTKDDKPLVFLFIGSSGVGKTQMAKNIGKYLNGNDNGFIRIDMTEYQQKSDAKKFIGSSPGYVGYEDGGQLTEKLKEFPNAVVLFDEVEKAHPDVVIILLQLFDEGRLTDGKGQTVHGEEALYIMTSNLGTDAVTEYWRREKKKKKIAGQVIIPDSFKGDVVQPILKKHFKRNEFLGRINETVIFLPFTEDELVMLVTKEMRQWAKRAKTKHGLTLTWDEAALKVLADGYDVNYGARSIENEVNRKIVNNLSEIQRQCDELILNGGKIHVSVVIVPPPNLSEVDDVSLISLDDDNTNLKNDLKMVLCDKSGCVQTQLRIKA